MAVKGNPAVWAPAGKLCAVSLAKTEYWVSQSRKYCEFCKCYIADNKPSISFHESGKKHKENVKTRLGQMQKKATKDASAAATVERQMKKMEEAAMKAYLKDIEDNPDFTSQLIKEKCDAAGTSLDSIVAKKQDKEKEKEVEQQIPEKVKEKKWMEAKTAEDLTYYWHVETGESVWEAPKGGYISIEDQKDEKPSFDPKVKKAKKMSVADINKQIYGGSSNEARTGQAPPPSTQTVGKWTAVVKQEVEFPELDLPDVKPLPLPVVSVPTEERQRGFKERKAPVTASQGGEEVAFKKRKIGGARNARQRGNDD